jgi:hypothetical protein
MDEKHMNPWSFDVISNWTFGLNLAGYLAAGTVLGLIYFGALWWTANLFAGGGRAAMAIGLTIGRFVLLGGSLTLVSLEGAAPLLAVALGVLLGRFAVMLQLAGGAS